MPRTAYLEDSEGLERMKDMTEPPWLPVEPNMVSIFLSGILAGCRRLQLRSCGGRSRWFLLNLLAVSLLSLLVDV